MQIPISLRIFIIAFGLAELASAKTEATFSGDYFYNFEFAYLTADGNVERWCIKGDMARAELPEGWGTSHVVVQGTLGPPGHYGNLGACQRVLTVTRLVKVTNMRGRQ